MYNAMQLQGLCIITVCVHKHGLIGLANECQTGHCHDGKLKLHSKNKSNTAEELTSIEFCGLRDTQPTNNLATCGRVQIMSAPNNNNKVTLPFGVQSLQEGSMKTISKGKLATFAVGQQKKSRFQKAREEKEKKAKEEEAEAAAVYESFVASFEDGDADGKTFIRWEHKIYN